MFSWEQQYGAADHDGGAQMAFTDRHGGASNAPYDSLNLGSHVGDDPAAVQDNRGRVAAAFGVGPGALVFMEQVHGVGVHVVDQAPAPGTPPPRVDALVTANRDLALVAVVADCAPVLLADPVAGVVAAAHAGRAGMAAGVVDKVLDAMVDAGADLGRTVARVGPSVCGYCYEVPEPLRAEVAAHVPASVGVTRHGTPSLDVPAGVLSQLAARLPDVLWVGPCTLESADHFSYRRANPTGRSAGIVRAAPAPG